MSLSVIGGWSGDRLAIFDCACISWVSALYGSYLTDEAQYITTNVYHQIQILAWGVCFHFNFMFLKVKQTANIMILRFLYLSGFNA